MADPKLRSLIKGVIAGAASGLWLVIASQTAECASVESVLEIPYAEHDRTTNCSVKQRGGSGGLCRYPGQLRGYLPARLVIKSHEITQNLQSVFNVNFMSSFYTAKAVLLYKR